LAVTHEAPAEEKQACNHTRRHGTKRRGGKVLGGVIRTIVDSKERTVRVPKRFVAGESFTVDLLRPELEHRGESPLKLEFKGMRMRRCQAVHITVRASEL
jgi:hypothetical protein